MASRLKEWVATPFQYLEQHLRESGRFAETTEFGIRHTGRLETAEQLFQELEKITKPDAPLPAERAAELDALKRRAAIAKEEIDLGIPMLHASLAVGTWSALEATIGDFVIAWLCNVPEALNSDDLRKIKIPLAEFERENREGRMQILLDEYKRNARVSMRGGIERFESLLKPIGLSGAVDKETARGIFELSHVRNVIAHRASRVDKRFLEACPWFDLQPNDKLLLTSAHTNAYARAITEYAKAILLRVRKCDVALEQSGDAAN